MARSWLIAPLLAASCGPIAYVNGVTLHASDAVESARAVDADKYAPYWWTRATQYLYEARRDAAHADFQGATHFGLLATEAADKAAAAAKDPANRPPPVAPAKDTPAPATVAPAKDTPTVAPAKDTP